MDWVFAAAAAVSVVAGFGVVTQRNPVHSAISLLVCFLSFAVIYLKLGASFLAALHVLVYTGAILVLFLFVIMLLNLKPEELGEEYRPLTKGILALMSVGLFLGLAIPLWNEASRLPSISEAPPGFGGIEVVGRTLFSDYALPFELVSVLILVAIFGGVVLAKKKI